VSYKLDTVAIIGDSGGTVVAVKYVDRIVAEKTTLPVPRSGALSVRCTATVQVFPVTRSREAALAKDARGEVAHYTHLIYAPRTSSVSVTVGDRLYAAGESDWWEVVRVDEYEDHIRILGALTEER